MENGEELFVGLPRAQIHPLSTDSTPQQNQLHTRTSAAILCLLAGDAAIRLLPEILPERYSCRCLCKTGCLEIRSIAWPDGGNIQHKQDRQNLANSANYEYAAEAS